MRLLITTQKVDENDSVLGFFVSWLREFAKHFEEVVVISLLTGGKRDLPENVRVLELGKGWDGNRITYIRKFYKYIKQEKNNYDIVFCHMNPEYAVLAGHYWQKVGKKIFLWYVHKAVPPTLRLAAHKVEKIFTASKQSCNLNTDKIKVLGHGIDLEKFQIANNKTQINSKFNIIYVGRISDIKNQDLLIQALDIMVNNKKIKNLNLQIIGGIVYPRDKEYKNKLQDLISQYNLKQNIEFIGEVPSHMMARFYNKADLSINLCPTGGVDKAVLESMASGIPVIVYNKSFAPDLEPEFPNMILKNLNKDELAGKIELAMNAGIEKEKLRKIIKDKYSLVELIKNIKHEIDLCN